MSMRKVTKGAVIETFNVNSNGRTHTLKLRLSKAYEHGLRTFSYAVDHDEPKFRVEDKDPSTCMAKAKNELLRLSTLEWKPTIRVTVTQQDLHYGRKSKGAGEPRARSLAIEYELIDVSVGVTPTLWRKLAKDNEGWGGRARMRRQGEHEVVEGDPCADRYHDNSVISIVEDTPVNRAAIECIVCGIETLTKRVQQLLNPEQIQRTLADVKVLALPAPATEIRLKGKRPKLRKRP